jgi:hypothetical protein
MHLPLTSTKLYGQVRHPLMLGVVQVAQVAWQPEHDPSAARKVPALHVQVFEASALFGSAQPKQAFGKLFDTELQVVQSLLQEVHVPSVCMISPCGQVQVPSTVVSLSAESSQVVQELEASPLLHVLQLLWQATHSLAEFHPNFGRHLQLPSMSRYALALQDVHPEAAAFPHSAHFALQASQINVCAFQYELAGQRQLPSDCCTGAIVPDIQVKQSVDLGPEQVSQVEWHGLHLPSRISL